MKYYIVLFLFFTTSLMAWPLKVMDSFGNELILQSPPKRVISLAPNITETIYALKKQDLLVGRTDYCDYPKQVKNIPSIGQILTPSFEAILLKKPDLIIASTHFSQELVKRFEAFNIKVLTLYSANSFEQVYKMINTLGEVLEAKKEASKIVAKMQNQLELLENKIKTSKRPKVYYMYSFGRYGDYTAGGDTFISQLIEKAGALNVAKHSKGWKYSVEQLLEDNPELILCSKYFNTKQKIYDMSTYSTLNAVKNKKVFEIDNNRLDRQGPRLIESIYEMAKIFHPELF